MTPSTDLPRARRGTLIRSTDRARLDQIVASGLDWLMLDGEHPSVGPAQIAEMLSIIDHRLPSYVRVRALDRGQIEQALAEGAEGIIVPNVDSPEQAVESVAIVRGSRWPHASVVVQAESVAAVQQATQIAATPGIEWVLIGPYDLTRSLGIPEQFDAPAYHDAVDIIESACLAAGVPVGIFGMTPEAVAPFATRGFGWLVTGIDRAG